MELLRAAFIVVVAGIFSFGYVFLYSKRQLSKDRSRQSAPKLCSYLASNNNNTNKADRVSQINCSVQWPDVELFLTTPASPVGFQESYQWFLPSLALFWPSLQQKLKLLIVTDVEAPLVLRFTQRLETLVKSMIPRVEVRSVLTKKASLSVKGWDKSQWLKLWADNFTNATYVGFVDTDTVFVTRVATEDMFINNKPVLRPVYGKPRAGWDGHWPDVPVNTFTATGLKEPFNCMSFFPVIVKVAHLKVIREIVMRQLNVTTFDKAIRRIWTTRFYSEYNMMCTVLWWHFRDEYYWVINEGEVGWKGPVPEGQVANLTDAEITEELLNRTRPHLSVHWTYVPFKDKPSALRDTLRKGVCFSLTEREAHPCYCSKWNRTRDLNPNEFLFELDNFSRRPAAYEAHLRRIRQNEACPHEWIPERLAELC